MHLTKYTGRIIGAHQKIDRVARRHLGELLPPHTSFPPAKSILKFEGKNGPDGIKIKSPARDEPWHYVNPYADENTEFLRGIATHYKALVRNLKKTNDERSAFEAAWLAHALVDGMTPAHHYPYEEKLKELTGGLGREHRTTIKHKLIQKGETKRQTLFNFYKYMGPKGLMMGHALFEQGFAYIVTPLRLPDARPTPEDMRDLKRLSLDEFFIRRVREVAMMDMYDRYLNLGWTPKLSNEVRHHLAPLMVSTVTLVWYKAADEAGLCVPLDSKERA